MDYKKEYQKALERAKKGLPIDEVFPELRESEDERIREWIIGIINGCKDLNFKDKVKLTRYLEKQKEPKDVSASTMAPGCWQGEQKPAEWSKEDKDYFDAIIAKLEVTKDDALLTDNQIDFLKSLPERFNIQPKQESEPIEIKYAGKIYKVYGTKELPGGVVGYIIEDEPGHYDCIMHPDEVLGGGYGIKSNGSPYPTKEANFGQPHWKPSEEQMDALEHFIRSWGESGTMSPQNPTLCAAKTLLNDLKKL